MSFPLSLGGIIAVGSSRGLYADPPDCFEVDDDDEGARRLSNDHAPPLLPVPVLAPRPSLAASFPACPPRLLPLSSLRRLLSSWRSVRLAEAFASRSFNVHRIDERWALIRGSNWSVWGAREGRSIWSRDNGAFVICRATSENQSPPNSKQYSESSPLRSRL